MEENNLNNVGKNGGEVSNNILKKGVVYYAFWTTIATTIISFVSYIIISEVGVIVIAIINPILVFFVKGEAIHIIVGSPATFIYYLILLTPLKIGINKIGISHGLRKFLFIIILSAAIIFHLLMVAYGIFSTGFGFY